MTSSDYLKSRLEYISMRHRGVLSLFLVFAILINAPLLLAKKIEIPKTPVESEIGDQIHRQIMAAFRPYTEPKVIEYINGINQSMLKHVERKNLNYEVVVLYANKIYATSAPGGRIYVTTALINFLENESQLAGVLAHELGELQYQDPKLSKSKKVMQAISKGGSMVAPVFGSIGALASLGFAMLHTAVDASTKTAEERLLKADQKALRYMVLADHDPQGFLDLQYKFLNASKDQMPYFYEYYQSRPISMERWNALMKTFGELPLSGKKFDARREAYLQATKGIREIYLAAS